MPFAGTAPGIGQGGSETKRRSGAAGCGQRLPPRSKTAGDPAFGARADRFGRDVAAESPAATAYTPARGEEDEESE